MIDTSQMSRWDISQLAHLERRSVHELGTKTTSYGQPLNTYSMDAAYEGCAHSPKIA